jgi:hypothetical protein
LCLFGVFPDELDYMVASKAQFSPNLHEGNLLGLSQGLKVCGANLKKSSCFFEGIELHKFPLTPVKEEFKAGAYFPLRKAGNYFI